MKKEAIQYLNDLAIEFHHNTKHQISNTIKRAIHENFYLNNQMDYLSNQLEKSIQINKTCTQDNQRLTRTVAILEDVETQSAKKFLTTEHVSHERRVYFEAIHKGRLGKRIRHSDALFLQNCQVKLLFQQFRLELEYEMFGPSPNPAFSNIF